ncbi:hypothetical protein L202_01238 [Cryptococcus amylolentus CBS 6039]|uniref:DNA-directed RNA polymerase III subunit RPC5 n=2 Tax=Cryptococcus amylolentus TaxID=104669 RepID=A0A1E3I3A8_9TREE|nr:hypothetical protein L202_01238 [Cryptococcus amylolentus CBS 6039]ODN83007.1 hypothetical protein L202_01238 [Cryptococcus amylolentus CBS 6039]ODO10630.1 hypothetical protein I350_01227 [Cryptococcus amylolentus CBS 6273]
MSNQDHPIDQIEVATDSINFADLSNFPIAPSEEAGPHLSASEAHPSLQDAAGPSTTYIPRQPSPPLPDLKTRSFPAVDADSDEEDADDEPIATLPVYMSPALLQQGGVDIYQYPLQHRDISVPTWARDRGKTISARVKENVARVEVEIPVDAGAAYWREDRASELGFVVDVTNGDDSTVGGYGFGGKEKDKKGKEKASKKKEEKWGDKMRLSSEVVPNATGYYTGVIRDGAVHLCPVSRVLQFRTSLGYLDDVEQRSRTRRTTNGNAESDDEDAPKKKRAPPQPVAKPRKVLDDEENDGTGSIKDFRNKMWAMAQKEDEDNWVAYQWKAGGEESSVVDALEGLILPEEKRERLTCKTRPLDYLDRAQ